MNELEAFKNGCIINLVEKIVNDYPDSTAIIQEQGDLKITYKELDRRANELSSFIGQFLLKSREEEHNKSSGDFTPLVSIMCSRGIGMITSILGILKAGAAYVPVDPTFPENRQQYIFTHSQSQLLIVDEENFHRISSLEVTISDIIVMDRNSGELIRSMSSSPASSVKSHYSPNRNGLAYVLYTSGSTGKPKGVMVINRSVVNIVKFFADEMKLTVKDNILGLTTFCFDISVLEFFLPLITGGSLVISSSNTQKNPLKIINLLEKYKISVMQATPTTYEMMIATGEWTGNPNIQFLVGGNNSFSYHIFLTLLIIIILNRK